MTVSLRLKATPPHVCLMAQTGASHTTLTLAQLESLIDTLTACRNVLRKHEQENA